MGGLEIIIDKDYVCLHKIKLDERSARGETELNTFKDVDCHDCTYDKMSAILCPYYVNRTHIEQFNDYQL